MKPQLRPGQKLAAIGGFQTGKTTALRKIGEAMPACVAWDPNQEFIAAGWAPANVGNMASVAAKNSHVAVYGSPNREFEPFNEQARFLHGWGVIWDEINMSISGTSPASIPEHASVLWRTGHKDGITVMWQGHRVREVPRLLRAVQHVLHFRPADFEDREDVEKMMGPGWGERAAQMGVGEYAYKAPDGSVRAMPPMPL